jgi:hypothetical protein
MDKYITITNEETIIQKTKYITDKLRDLILIQAIITSPKDKIQNATKVYKFINKELVKNYYEIYSESTNPTYNKMEKLILVVYCKIIEFEVEYKSIICDEINPKIINEFIKTLAKTKKKLMPIITNIPINLHYEPHQTIATNYIAQMQA